MTDEKKPSNPLQIAADVTYPKLVTPAFNRKSTGKFVKVRLAGEAQKTHLGIYMGDMPNLTMRVDRIEEDHSLVMRIDRSTFGNPAIYVPDLNQIVYGMESWWGEIEKPDDLKEITDLDIENVWYVQALKSLDAAA